jgi:hypothetical protein
MDKKFCVDYNLATRHRLNTVTVIPDTSHSPQLVALSALRSAGLARNKILNARVQIFFLTRHFKLVEQRFRKAEVSSSTLESGL